MPNIYTHTYSRVNALRIYQVLAWPVYCSSFKNVFLLLKQFWLRFPAFQNPGKAATAQQRDVKTGFGQPKV